jgi:hypothetical protein
MEKISSTQDKIEIARIIPPEQQEVANFLLEKIFSKIPKDQFFLVGGTAVALKFKHRQSIDFDFFCFPKQKIEPDGSVSNNYENQLMGMIDHLFRSENIYQRRDLSIDYGHLQYLIKNVGVTFLAFQNLMALTENDCFHIPQFPNEIEICPLKFQTVSIKDIAGLKAFARINRSKMKDVVDIAEIMHHGITLAEILEIAKKQFGYEISKKEVVEALLNLQDIDNNTIDEEITYTTDRDTTYYTNFLKKECLNLLNENT